MTTTVEQHNMSVIYTENNHQLIISESDGTVVNVVHSPEPNISVTPSTLISDYTIGTLITQSNALSVNGYISASGTGTFNGIVNHGMYLGYGNINLIGGVVNANVTGSLSGTASFATNASNASTAAFATTSSFAATSAKINALSNGENENQYLAFLDDDNTVEQRVLYDSDLNYNPAKNVFSNLTGKNLSLTNMTQYHVSAMVNPFGKTHPVGPSFEGAKYTFWSQNHFGNSTPPTFGDEKMELYAQWAMAGIPVVADCRIQSAVLAMQPQENGVYTIHVYSFPGFAKGQIMDQDKLVESNRVISGSITYTSEPTDTFTGFKPPGLLNPGVNGDVVITEGSFLIVYATCNNGKPYYMDVALNAQNL